MVKSLQFMGWGAWIFLNYSFLWIYTQDQGDLYGSGHTGEGSKGVEMGCREQQRLPEEDQEEAGHVAPEAQVHLQTFC